MFVVQRSLLRTVRPFAFRSNATLSTGSELKSAATHPPHPTSTAAAGSATTQDGATGMGGGRINVKSAPRRRTISNQNPRPWNPPLASGVIPAYDLALEVLRKDSLALKEEIAELKKAIESEEKRYQELVKVEGKNEHGEAYALDLELEKKRQKLHILQVQSEVNLPDVRWKVANAMVDMNIPSHRHLVEQKWRKDGDLDLLMERIYQMKVVPDVLPVIRPSLDLHLATQAPSRLTPTFKTVKLVEPGVFLAPRLTVEPPRLYANVFHTDTRLYTLMLVDPDVPDESTASYTTYLHWLQPNVPLTATHTSQILDLNNHTKYIPPHPQRGTPYHRYTVLLLPQPPLEGGEYTKNVEARANPGVPTSKKLDIPVVSDAERLGFNVRQFCQTWGLDASTGGGLHMFREVWDEEVSKIYKDVLGQEEPRYGRIPKPDPYAELKHRKKYVS
ncbi:hypothetical protein CC1G_13488 [Coprinopsis cinerea okayama7|uniref:PEBP-like protein n=1 Tax=Coprinopsis cinerea (strain Okayama-7 / 130 / ATCC MYA-4618 / FGSC 9003) TaxID=240176 RepID=A8PIC2_COPC7|nr:hypothetical protein CC1G_13488 [Coprinopsis cinerea okayama7\|eukprot:XP_001841550.2 hypothetical protein CC1G_13488 [Coprinopsis cinerea okayama7\